LKDEEKERKRAEKARKQKEKEERAKSMGKKNFVIKKAEKSSLDQVCMTTISVGILCSCSTISLCLGLSADYKQSSTADGLIIPAIIK